MALLDDIGIYADNLSKGSTAVVSGTVGAVAGAIVGGSAVALATSGNKTGTSRKRNSRIKHTKRGWKQDRKRFNKSQKWEVAYRKRKAKKGRSRSGKIKYTKKGQPYIILKSGKARFIKKRKGGAK